MRPDLVSSNRLACWVQDVVISTAFADVNGSGNARSNYASNPYGIRLIKIALECVQTALFFGHREIVGSGMLFHHLVFHVLIAMVLHNLTAHPTLLVSDKMRPDLINTSARASLWLQDVVISTIFTRVYDYGFAGILGASGSSGVHYVISKKQSS